MADRSAYLVVRSKAPHVNFDRFQSAASIAVGEHGGRTVAAVNVSSIEVLEPGSIPQHTAIFLMPSAAMAESLWERLDKAELSKPEAPLAFIANAVPDDGFADPAVPTLSSVGPTPSARPALMMIEGGSANEGAMERYRNIIFPLLFANAGYYTVYEPGSEIQVLSGHWEEDFFAISRWRDRETGRAFWLAEKYQNEAIPIRIDVGTFEVVLLDGEGDD